MTKTSLLDLHRLIQATRSRFFSLTAIVALGVAFFVGVTSTSPTMAYSVGIYEEELNLKDITIYSNYGFDEEDVRAVRDVGFVKQAEGAFFVDVVAADGTESLVTRVHSFSPASSINQFQLKSGRLPEKPYEALSESGTELIQGFPIGSHVKLSRTDDDLGEYLSVEEVVIVGMIDTPVYLNETKENSTLSNQYIKTYLYLPEEAFVTDYYLEMNVTLNDSFSYSAFSDDYYSYAEDCAEKLETLASSLSSARKDKLVQEAEEKYNEGYQEYLDGLETFRKEMADAERKIQEGEAELEDGKKQLENAEKQIHEAEETLASSEAEGRKQIQDARDLIQGGLNEVNGGTMQIEEAESRRSEINSGIEQCRAGIEQIEQAEKMLRQAQEGLRQIEDGLASIDAALPLLEQMESILQMIPLKDEVTLEDTETIISFLSSYFSSEYALIHTFGELKDLMNRFTRLYDQALQYVQENVESIPDELLSEASRIQTKLKDLNTALAQLPYPDETELSSMSDLNRMLEEYLKEAETPPVTLGELRVLIHETLEMLKDQKQTLTDMYSEVLSQLAQASIQKDTIDEKLTELEVQKQELQKLQADLEDTLKQIDTNKERLSEAYKELMAAYAETINAEELLEEKLAEGRAEIEAGYREIEENRRKLQNGEEELSEARKELEQARKDTQEELDQAFRDLRKARQDIDDLEEGSWTVLDRTKHYASETYRQTLHQMDAIAAVFPVFFLFVAALVCMTTMSRMIDEHRGEIGVYRALGFSVMQCAGKYLLYAGAASLIGSVFGTVLGLVMFPTVIYHTWRMMYVLPEYQVVIPWGLIAVTFIAFLAVMCGTTWFSVSQDMKDVPAQLMRPKAPKMGTKTLLERITPLWSILPFSWKVTIRNLFRYKKRFVMTVIGVAGCGALLVTGFGIRDSINSMVDIQFDEILQYDGMVSLAPGLSSSRRTAFLERLRQRTDVQYADLFCSYSAIVRSENVDKDETVQTVIYDRPETLLAYYTLRNRISGKSILPEEQGVIINERLSENLHVKEGDVIILESENGVRAEAVISDVTEMYIQHYAFLSEQYYQELFGFPSSANAVFVRVNGNHIQNQLLQEDLVGMEETKSIEFFDARLENFSTMVKGLNMIVWVILAASMSLAFVVLGNLISVNISERQREIATLKVLGFRKREVESYIFKENYVLTAIGSFVGIPVGRWLHGYIMGLVEMDYVIFGRRVLPLSVLLSVLLTNLFGICVNILVKKRLSAIQMVESLKSVE